MPEPYVKKVLNVGGGSRTIPIPDQYAGWQQVLLDIDPRCAPDVVCDARELMEQNGNEYDAVYCSHNLEHYYHHDVPRVLRGFAHVLKAQGFAEVRVPNLDGLMRTVVEKGLDVDDHLYQSPVGPITVRDVIYGFGVEIERSRNDFFAHKTGFSPKSLTQILTKCGFPIVYTAAEPLEIRTLAFKEAPAEEIKSLFSLPPTR
jgi:hypothetical protein